MTKIFMIDDDSELCEKMKAYFSQFSLELSFAVTPELGEKAIKEGDYKVLILDGSLPGKDGFDICKEVRLHSQIPIIFLTGLVEEADRILGLESGADDYVTKPFSPRELVARVKSQIRRLDHREKSAAPTSLNDDFNLLEGSYELQIKGKKVNLTANEFEILHYLYSLRGEVKTREEIMQGIHGDTWETFDRSLDIAISRIRKKIKEHIPEKELIKTVRGKGYMFVDGQNE